MYQNYHNFDIRLKAFLYSSNPCGIWQVDSDEDENEVEDNGEEEDGEEDDVPKSKTAKMKGILVTVKMIAHWGKALEVWPIFSL